MLTVRGLTAGYGESQVLFGVEFAIEGGQVVALLGRNGMGKTTTVSSIMGILRPSGGEILFDRQPIHGLPTHRIARLGIGLVPEGRQIFPNLTVRENLVATAANHRHRSTPWTLARIAELFPPIAARMTTMAGLLSGGEQQMVAIGRALMTNPGLLILDEATEGLAPLVRAEIWRVLGELKRAGLAIMVIDKDVDALTRIADRHFILEKGAVVWFGSSSALRADDGIRRRYLGIE
jgi:branched-chain amino acid transport system ATP-binding protein